MSVPLSNLYATFADPNFTFTALGLNVNAVSYASGSNVAHFKVNNSPIFTITLDGSIKIPQSFIANGVDVLAVSNAAFTKANSVLANTNQTIEGNVTVKYSFGVGTAASGITGEIRAANNVIAYYSDRRLKTDIIEICDALDKIKSVSGVYFRNNEVANKFGFNDDSIQVGVIAQEIQAVLPQVIKPAPFDSDDGITSKTGENYLTVQYDRLVPLLIEAIKELDKKIEDLTKRLDM